MPALGVGVGFFLLKFFGRRRTLRVAGGRDVEVKFWDIEDGEGRGRSCSGDAGGVGAGEGAGAGAAVFALF